MGNKTKSEPNFTVTDHSFSRINFYMVASQMRMHRFSFIWLYIRIDNICVGKIVTHMEQRILR